MTIFRRKIRKKIDSLAPFLCCSAAFLIFFAFPAAAQTVAQGWLDHGGFHGVPPVPLRVTALGSDPLEGSAAKEIQEGIRHLYGTAPFAERSKTGEAIILGTARQIHAAYPDVNTPADLAPEGFWIAESQSAGRRLVVVAGGSGRGVLYGAFALVRQLATSGWTPQTKIVEAPAMPIRWLDEWDNADGTVERGYAGPSIFFEDGHVRDDLAPVAEYARLLASVGINGVNVNNVNGAAPFLEPQMLQGLARVANTMRPWGVRLSLSVDIASPQKIGGLKTFDPLDPAVQSWWAAKVAEIYALIPDLAGFTVKADSEGQAGPASYGRSPADAANVLAHALAPHGGVVLYRAFVYNNHLDYNDLKADRARAAYDIFHPLDGRFAPNVVVQTKEGPIDFQAQEPVSPLFAGLRQTSQAMELQITQEYTGQQRHLVYLAPMWKWVLDFDLRVEDRSTPVKEIIEGKTFHRPLGGLVGVPSVGREGWLGSPLALANLYAFGRLAWNPDLTPEQIAAEWVRQTISVDPEVVSTVVRMLMQSWPAYVDYTGPLGTQTLTPVVGSHYGPNVESSERNGWGQWHRDDAQGIGMDRTVATGTGYIGQYPPAVAKMYESLESCPDNLLLFFHHVPYTYKLHSGQTVIQYFYDSHYRGAEEAQQLVDEWRSLNGKVAPALYSDVLARLTYQAGHAIVWRDAIVQYFLKLSGIPDEKGRAGHYPGRLEAEDARLTGYKVIDVNPWEDASRGKAVVCGELPPLPPRGAFGPGFSASAQPAPKPPAPQSCSAEWTWNGTAGSYSIVVQYFDLAGGQARFSLSIDGRPVQAWTAAAHLPSRQPNGDNSTRITVPSISLKPGDRLRIDGTSDAFDPAALDYIEVIPAHAATEP